MTQVETMREVHTKDLTGGLFGLEAEGVVFSAFISPQGVGVSVNQNAVFM